MHILTVADMQALEAAADAAGHSYAQMMALAGEAVASAIRQRHPVAGKQILVLVGPGNNGGDGLVAAAALAHDDARVTAYLAREREASADQVFAAAVTTGVTVVLAEEDHEAAVLSELVVRADIIVDALLGTGASLPLRGIIVEILDAVRSALAARMQSSLVHVQYIPTPTASSPDIVAVDGPSGLDFDTGQVDDLTLQADLTVTFAFPKWGHATLPGAARCGELLIADIGIPESVKPSEGPHLATASLAAQWLPDRPPDAHKGTFGKVMITAGSANYTGAAILASRAAVRSGAGLVTLALPSELHTAVVAAIPEVTYLLLPHTLGGVNEQAAGLLLEHLTTYTALLIGPGIGNTPESRAFLTELLGNRTGRRSAGFLRSETMHVAPASLPALVIDADGLNILAQIPGWAELLPADTILTPHPGEMSRLTGVSTSTLQANRVEIAITWAENWQQVVVLKGAFTVIAAPNRPPVLLPFANSGLSSAGTGDVLAGAIAALRAQGLPAFEAAVVGSYLHGLAGEIVLRNRGSAGTAAGDVAEALGEAWRRVAALKQV